MPVPAAPCIIGITDQRRAAQLDLARLKKLGCEETASKRGHNDVTVIIDLDRRQKPVVFPNPGTGKDSRARFAGLFAAHGSGSSPG